MMPFGLRASLLFELGGNFRQHGLEGVGQSLLRIVLLDIDSLLRTLPTQVLLDELVLQILY